MIEFVSQLDGYDVVFDLKYSEYPSELPKYLISEKIRAFEDPFFETVEEKRQFLFERIETALPLTEPSTDISKFSCLPFYVYEPFGSDSRRIYAYLIVVDAEELSLLDRISFSLFPYQTLREAARETSALSLIQKFGLFCVDEVKGRFRNFGRICERLPSLRVTELRLLRDHFLIGFSKRSDRRVMSSLRELFDDLPRLRQKKRDRSEKVWLPATEKVLSEQAQKLSKRAGTEACPIPLRSRLIFYSDYAFRNALSLSEALSYESTRQSVFSFS